MDYQPQSRPLSITLISWLSIISGFANLGYLIYLLAYKSETAQISYILVSGISTILLIGASITMLEGKGWGRHLYISISIFFTGILFFTIGIEEQHTMIYAIRTVFFAFFLYKPNSNAYFKAVQNNGLQKSQ